MHNLAQPERSWIACVALALTLALAMPAGVAAAPGDGCLGFGSTTAGGQGGEVYHVTTLADSGPGSLRDAVSSGGRTVVFAVGGEIVLSDHIYVEGAFITIDGSSAPAPGITLRSAGLIIRGTRGAHDVIVEGLRIRDSRIDGIQVAYGAYNVVVSRVSVSQAIDGNIDITDASDVTVCHSVLADAAGHNMLLRGSTQVTLHDSLLVGAIAGSPNVVNDADGTPAPATTLDMRHNFVRDWAAGWGAAIHHGAAANVVENLFWSKNSAPGDQANALIVCRGDCGADPTSLARAYVADNLSGDPLGAAINAEGTEPAPLPAPDIPSRHACTAARAVLDTAGAWPRDAFDATYLGALAMPPACTGDLIVSALTAPASAAPGATVTVEDTVTNRGPGLIAESSATVFYLSPTAGRDGAEIRLGERTVPPLAANETHTATTSLVIPAAAGALGTYYIVAVADGNELLAEALDDNNVRARRISVGPDLIIDGVWVPESAAPGDTIAISVAVRNRGVGPIGATPLRLFLGTQPALTGAGALETYGVPELAAGTTHMAAVNVTIPETAGTATGGIYYIVAQADGTAGTSELNEDNNVRAARVMIGPDLVFDAVTAPATAVAGGTLNVTDTIRNRGAGPVRATNTQFYLSPVATIDSRSVLIGSRAVGRLAAGETSIATTTLVIPPDAGSATPYYLIAVADAAHGTGELDESNNMRSTRVGIGPDLVIDVVTAPNATAPGTSIQVGDTARNRGVSPAAPFNVRYYLSTTTTLNAQAVLLGERSVPALGIAATHAGTLAVTIPASAGTAAGGIYYVVAVADGAGGVSESDETNNTRATRVIIGPDLTLDALTGPTVAAPGATVTLSWTVRNRGVGPTPSTILRFHLSKTTTIGAPPVVLGQVTVPPILSGATTSGTATVGVPASAGSLGWGYVVAVANPDAAIGELVTTNNLRAARLGVGPDLTVDSIVLPGALAPGASVTIEDVTRNRGIGPVGESVTTFYLSVSPALDAGAVEVGRRLVPALAAGATHRGSAALTLPPGVGSASTYYLLARADGVDAITETLETNNVRAITAVIGPDLVVDSVIAPSVALAGHTMTVTDTTRNRGIGPAPASFTRFYLSVRTVLDALAIPLGQREVPGLPAGATNTGTVQLLVPPTVGEAGVYYVLAVADGGLTTSERDETNNLRWARVAIGPDLIIDSVAVPASVGGGDTLALSDNVRNRGLAPSVTTSLRFYLSTRKTYDPFLAVPVGARTVPALAGGARDLGVTHVTIPPDVVPASYYLIGVIDDADEAVETQEDNNGRYWPLVVQ
jgi:subtilase family serine protease